MLRQNSLESIREREEDPTNKLRASRIPSSRSSAKFRRLPASPSLESEGDTIDYILQNQVLITETDDVEDNSSVNDCFQDNDVVSQNDDNESLLDFDIEGIYCKRFIDTIRRFHTI